MYYNDYEPAPTLAEIVEHDVRFRGERNPKQAWIGTNYDTWHPNPFYDGEPVPHPEDHAQFEDNLLVLNLGLRGADEIPF